MRKIFLVAALLGFNSLVHATTIPGPSSLIGTDTLNGSAAYSWNVSIAVPAGETIVAASIDFTDIKLTASGNSAGTGVLYTDLLNTKKTGVTTATDNDAPGDYWATQFSGANITSIGTMNFAYVGQTLSALYTLNTTELAALNSYLVNGAFNIGIDPDCHFNVGDISFSYTLGSNTPHNVPDVATTAFLMLLGLAGLEVFRRQFVAAKIKG